MRLKESAMRETTMKLIVAAVLGVFAAFSGYVSWRHGYMSAFPPFGELPTLQIFCDLLISLSLVLLGMYIDWRWRGRPRFGFSPYAVATVLLGSMGPLLYLLFRRGALGPTNQLPVRPEAR